MQSIKLCSHVGGDGILHLEIPVGITDKEMEVVVIYQQIEPSAPPKTPQELGWPAGFFEQTAGSLADDPIQRYPQGEHDTREPLE
ncbi:hypothetical protein IQ276_037745 [Desmonostoc muscorum LEGE 12446]|uniref:Uncharacterized protein n=1 Tax=Desmonostoc muscorum LEGE 12446 TaxID=1828758 RepID=A0A8J6ZVB9_DESMC|nr:hypothetical protein [Desmonostoc muscorum]MCF2152046.1 hypothetical protein [Desmonostoc muscorum LEGE 12446]